MGSSLRLLTWDDPRATGPLGAAIAAYTRKVPDVAIELDRRPLAAFNDEPIEEAAARADLVVFDHPMVPRAATRGALRPLDEILGRLDPTTTSAVGGSADSYRWRGRTWGLPIDAACQVMASRLDLLDRIGAAPPDSVSSLLELAEAHPSRVVLPLYPSDAFCTLLTLSAAHARAADEPVSWLRRDALADLIALVARTDPRGFDLNPPAVLRGLREHDSWALAPFIFGYANVNRHSLERRIGWHDLPTVAGARASILGGAGLGISSSTRMPEVAADFLVWFAGREVQRSIATPNGGQPACRAVWDDPEADREVAGFFGRTRRTIDAAFVRPQAPWWPDFQHEASVQLTRRLRRQEPANTIYDVLRELYAQHRGDLTGLSGSAKRSSHDR
jgi:multiple sugar transport system substrate-binding protein